MLDRQRAVEGLNEVLAAFRCLEGLGGAALRTRRGLGTDDDRDALADWESDELAEVRRKAQAQLEDLLDDEVRSGLEDLLFRVSAVTGLPPNEVRVQQWLIDDYGLSEVEHVRPLLREVARLLGRNSRPRGLRGFRRPAPLTGSTWRPYDHWNTALAKALFNEQHAGRSVYLDMEPEVLQMAASSIWPPTDTAELDVEAGFLSTVRKTCADPNRDLLEVPSRSGTKSVSFDTHAQRIEKWRANRQSHAATSEEPPPCIALLALCSLAAERMRADSEMGPRNYYGRLAEVLCVSNESISLLGSRYRKHALSLWEGLNIWLRDLHGQRGLPTAVSFGHQRFVSLPISQALIRAQERDRLPEFFTRYQFNPGQQVARDDMEGMLDRWIPNSGASGLRHVWGRSPEMRRRIADVVCTELEHWTGESQSPTVTGRQQRSLLVAATWYEEPKDEFDPFLCVRSSESETISGEYRMSDGAVVRAQRDADGLVTLSPGEHDPAGERALFEAALNDGLRLKHKTRDVTLSLAQLPVVVLLFDQLRQVYIQSTRVELGRKMLLLVDDGLSTQVKLALEQSAENGFRVVAPEVHGLPARWTLFIDVQLHSLPTVAEAELDALLPLSRTQVELEGGVQLTGSRWHSLTPPTVVAVDALDREFRVTLHSQSNLDEEPLELGTHAGQARIGLADRGLADGDYRIVLTGDGGAEITSRALKLRSANSAHLDPPLPSAERLAYEATPTFSPRSALSANQGAESAEGTLRGAVIDQRLGLRAVPKPRLQRALGGMEPFESIEAWIERVVGEVTEAGLEEAHGLLRRGLVEHRDGKIELTEAGERDIEARATGRSRRVSTAVPGTRESRSFAVDLDLILDALAVMEAGSWNAFRRLIDHSDEERYKPHEALRTLRALGYLDVEVDPRNAAPRQWSLSPPALLALPTRKSAVFAGRRTPELIEQLHEAASAEAADMAQLTADGRPARIQVDAEHPGLLQNIANAVDFPLIFDLPRRILERMPTIHGILVSQPELFVPEGCTFERFERSSNNWREADASVERLAGGYRIRFPTAEHRYAVWADGVWRECGNATAKYAGAAAVGEHIMAYDEERQELTCLFGARPPGLFERALILCSGELPQTPGDHRATYRNVPDNVHRWIAAKLGPAGWRR